MLFLDLCVGTFSGECRSAQYYGNIIAVYRCERWKENALCASEVMFCRSSSHSEADLSRHVTFPVGKKRFICCWLTNEGARAIAATDGATQTDHRGPTLNMLRFSAHFCAWKWKRERSMCLDASICVRVYCSRHFYEPAGCRGPKPQALPSPLLCNSLP